METDRAISALAALAHEKRLEAFRFLISAGTHGSASGALAVALDLQPSTMSVNLQRLARAGLVRSERRGKEIWYFADLEGAETLMRFLLKDCCGGRPEVCGSWLSEIAQRNRETST